MKKKIIILISFFAIAFQLVAQENTLLLTHPTKRNLRLFVYLIDNKIVNIDNLKIIGVYHKNEVYDYSRSVAFLENNKYSFIKLKEISEEISESEIFQNNKCSATYSELFSKSKGILFMGGPDIPPSMYGEKTSFLTEITDPYRHYFEASFLFHLLGGSRNQEFVPLLEGNTDYTILAICLGMQTMNIATGGTLYQDILSEIYDVRYIEDVLNNKEDLLHRNYNKVIKADTAFFSGYFHEIKVKDHKPLSGSYNPKNNPIVYSNHHQAIEKLGHNLIAIATSTDGKIIEAVKHKKYPNVLGIQFHPEGRYLYNPEIKRKQNPDSELKAARQILKENASFEFHLEFWNTFSKKINH